MAGIRVIARMYRSKEWLLTERVCEPNAFDWHFLDNCPTHLIVEEEIRAEGQRQVLIKWFFTQDTPGCVLGDSLNSFLY